MEKPPVIKLRNKTEIKMREELQYLREEQEALEYIRDAGHVFDSILFYMGQPHIKEKDRETLRLCLTILSRGGGI